MGMRYILPEHIVIALVSSGEIGSKQVIDRLGINIDKLKDEAVKRMRGEREGEAPKRKAVGWEGGQSVYKHMHVQQLPTFPHLFRLLAMLLLQVNARVSRHWRSFAEISVQKPKHSAQIP